MFTQLKQYYRAIVPQLTDEEWDAAEQRLQVKTLKKGEYLVREGERCDIVAYINTGFVRFFNVLEGKEISTGFIGAGEYVSEYKSFLTRRPAEEYIEAMEDSEFWTLNYDDIYFLQRNFPVYETFSKRIAEYLFIRISDCLYFQMALSPEQRYNRMIEHQSILLQKVPQYMIASYLGITPEHLSRLRKKTLNPQEQEFKKVTPILILKDDYLI